ncbi:serine/threonine protein kinase [Frigoriglobus tundricola]|uniref:Serine/threonine-protein kinase PknB n=1 Tax=Frigoriglobus tundricola TaxID=2774151 RepID=A0A6M5Z0X4_9BACT|nr:serine/threonine-protein kinase [Frigoriglobus tundricola]QJW99818.1 Serine/threonine-protein kinase PknB [Frigoriglobus tundricola]
MVGKTALGRYRLLRSLGSGSNAEVFLAEPLRGAGDTVVVKRIHDHVVEHPRFRQLFEAEVRSMANFSHPYAVGLIEASLDDPLGPCLVMEYVPGVTLETVLAVHKRLAPERVARLLGCFCHALQAAHDAGIVHRDLKPSNLMVINPDAPDESLKVMDFGFAGFSAKPHIQLAELTGHGPIYAIGTPGYVSPEMIRGDRVDGRSDLYSVGVILFELLTGRLPFNHDRQDRLLAAHIQEAPPRFHRIGCGFIPPAVEGVVQLALCKYPNERQQSAQELGESFGRAVGADFWTETAPAGWEPPLMAELEEVEPRELEQPADPFHVLREFEAYLPDRMAAAKLRGFVEDFKAEVLTSEPGLIRMRIGLPEGYKESKPGSGIFGWLMARRPSVPRGQEPIEVELHMEKPDPSQPRLSVLVAFRPLKDYPPKNREDWQERCDKVNGLLRQYLGA